jgi:hypothetical protein
MDKWTVSLRGDSRGISSLLGPAFEYLVMRRALIKPYQDRASSGWDVAHGVILAHESAHAIRTVEPHHGSELDLVAYVTAQKVDMAETRNVSRFDSRNHLARTIAS